jgi:hypothetical protein
VATCFVECRDIRLVRELVYTKMIPRSSIAAAPDSLDATVLVQHMCSCKLHDIAVRLFGSSMVGGSLVGVAIAISELKARVGSVVCGNVRGLEVHVY